MNRRRVRKDVYCRERICTMHNACRMLDAEDAENNDDSFDLDDLDMETFDFGLDLICTWTADDDEEDDDTTDTD